MGFTVFHKYEKPCYSDWNNDDIVSTTWDNPNSGLTAAILDISFPVLSHSVLVSRSHWTAGLRKPEYSLELRLELFYN